MTQTQTDRTLKTFTSFSPLRTSQRDCRGSVWDDFSVDTIKGSGCSLNLDVTCLFKAQNKPKGMQPWLQAITGVKLRGITQDTHIQTLQTPATSTGLNIPSSGFVILRRGNKFLRSVLLQTRAEGLESREQKLNPRNSAGV